MTNPNCEYSFNVPAIFTLSLWTECFDPKSGEIQSWDPVKASDLAIPQFLDEIKRKTSISVHSQDIRQKMLTSERDQDLVEINKVKI